ncbi:MAG: hypothetical protein QXT63_02815 [Thermoplasmata archaeon]
MPYTEGATRAPANYLKHDLLYYGTITSPSSVQAFCFTVPDYYFSAIAIKPLSGQNLDLDIYTDFDPVTNSFSGWMNTSDRGSGLVDLIVDGGAAYGQKESTIVDVMSDPPELIREGALSWQQIKEALLLA